jgi:hypothetical protein
MSEPKRIGPEFEASTFTHEGRTCELFRAGSGPGVVVVHELSGIHPRVIEFSRRLINAGYTTLTFDPVPAGTRMRWWWDITPRDLLRLVRPLVARLGQRQERANWAGLKRYLEQPASAPRRGRPNDK